MACGGEGNGTPLQYSCLENPMDGGAWWATVHGVAESRTRLSDFTFTSPPGHLYLPPLSSLLHVTLVPLQVPLTVEKLFIINLDVLSSVLYRWRSLEATVRIRLKTRSRRLKSKT